MKVFAIYANVELSSKPRWLGEFREKYDEPWKIHVTLKQPVFIRDRDIDGLREQAAKFFSAERTGKLVVHFDEVVIHKGESGITVMVRSDDADKLITLQKKLLQALSNHTNYTKLHHQAYEKNFDPHITIGRHLSDRQYEEASKYLKNGCACEGVIQEVVLSTVSEDTVEEGMNPDNHTAHSL